MPDSAAAERERGTDADGANGGGGGRRGANAGRSCSWCSAGGGSCSGCSCIGGAAANGRTECMHAGRSRAGVGRRGRWRRVSGAGSARQRCDAVQCREGTVQEGAMQVSVMQMSGSARNSLTVELLIDGSNQVLLPTQLHGCRGRADLALAGGLGGGRAGRRLAVPVEREGGGEEWRGKRRVTRAGLAACVCFRLTSGRRAAEARGQEACLVSTRTAARLGRARLTRSCPRRRAPCRRPS